MFRHWKTLRMKFIVGFLVVMIPLLVFVFFNNLYAMKVVRDQVSKAFIDQLEKQVEQHDLIMKQTNVYLYTVPERDSDISTLFFQPLAGNEYVVSRQRILNKFGTDIDFYSIIDSLFLYTVRGDEFIFESKSGYNTRKDVLYQLLPVFLNEQDTVVKPEWQIINTETDKALVKVVKINPDLYMGGWIQINDLLEKKEAGPNEHAGGDAILSKEGVPLSDTSLSAGKIELINSNLHRLDKDKPYQMVTDPASDQKYLLIAVKFALADVYYTTLIPEEAVLKNLPFFQRAIFLIPIVASLILLFALIFIRKVLFKPMNVMMQGMRRVIKGDLDVRLSQEYSTEFAFLIQTFNHMVYQIQHLKIDVYEEQLKTKEAEYRHLQVQINPHFYLNSLNIIYSLAALNKNDLVQQMAEHLAEYFRFAIRTNRSFVRLEEEINHISSYMEIQKLRFPGKLSFEASIPEAYTKCLIPPLTIQPFVENCIVHGFKNRKHQLRIEVMVQPDDRDEQTIQIIIRDNGPGFAEPLLEMLKSEQFDEKFGDQHLGIWNVRHRLKMKFGDRASITFENREEHGAIVTLRISKQLFDEHTGGNTHV